MSPTPTIPSDTRALFPELNGPEQCHLRFSESAASYSVLEGIQTPFATGPSQKFVLPG